MNLDGFGEQVEAVIAEAGTTQMLVKVLAKLPGISNAVWLDIEKVQLLAFRDGGEVNYVMGLVAIPPPEEKRTFGAVNDDE